MYRYGTGDTFKKNHFSATTTIFSCCAKNKKNKKNNQIEELFI